MPDGPLSLLVPVGPGRLELPLVPPSVPVSESVVPVPVVSEVPLDPLVPLRRRLSSSVMASLPMPLVPFVPLVPLVPDVPMSLVLPDPLVVESSVPIVPVPVAPVEPLPEVPLPDVVESVVVPVPPMPDVPVVPLVPPVVSPVVPDVPEASVAPLALVLPVPDAPLALEEPLVPLDRLVPYVPLVLPLVLFPVPGDMPEPLPVVVPPPVVVPVPVVAPAAAGLSVLMLPLSMVLSAVVDEVALPCANVAALAPSKERNTAIGSFFMLPPDNVNN